MEPVAPLTPAQVENAALAYVLEYEASEGRKARDTRYRGAPADVASGERVIEIKAFGGTARGQDLWLETRQVDEARAHPDTFWLYIVENVRQGSSDLFRLIQIGGDDLLRLLERAREKHYYEAPLPVALYDRLATD